MSQTASASFKKGTVKDMTKGNPFVNILMFALPVFLSQVFQQLYNTADSLIVGKFLGTEALAAVSSSGSLIFLLVSFFEGTAMGAGVVISKYFGGGNYDNVSKAIHTNILFGIICGVGLTFTGIFLTPTFLRWMQTDKDVLPNAIIYFRCYFYGALSLVMYNICRGIMNALGDSKRPLYYLIFSSLLNILLDVLFVGVFNFGIGSAAIATVISQTASAILCLIHLAKKGNIYTISFKKLKIHKDILVEIIKYGMPSGIQNSVIGFANVIVQSQINQFKKFAMAAYGAHAKIEGFAFLPITSFNMATTTFVSQNLGAKEHERAKKGATFSIISAVTLAEIIGVVLYFVEPYLIRLFDKSPEVIAYGTKQAHIVCLFYCLLAFSHSIASVCRGAGKAFVPMFIMLSVWCVFRILYIMLVMHFVRKIELIYWAYPITWAISSVIYLFYFIFSDWVHSFDKKEKKEEEEKLKQQTSEIKEEN